MTVNNNTNLINQICMSSGLEGKELDALRARLSKMSEIELQNELSQGLSGTKKDDMVGLEIQQTAPKSAAKKEGATTYTDGNGNEVSEIFDGDELVERSVTSKDENGKTTTVTTQYANNQPEKQTKLVNGNTVSTTTFTYHEETENNVAYVTAETKNADNSKVITTALETEFDGSINSEDIVDRTTISIDGTETTIYASEGRLIEQKVKPDGKKVLTAYNGTDISTYDDGKLYRLAQQVEHKGKVYYAEYDGQGNTKTVTQNGESPALIAQKFNVKENALRRLNPLRKNPHGKGKIDPLSQVGEEILINGQYNADSSAMRNRKSSEENIAKYTRQEYARRSQGLYSTEIKQQNLAKDYNGNYWALAKDLLGVNASKSEINGFAQDLQLLNGENSLKSGTAIRIPGKKASNENVKTLTTYGFKPSDATHGFYEKFNKLSANEQQNVLSTIKYLKSQNITNPTQIKTEVMKTLGINLFDSEKVIHMQGSGSATQMFNGKKYTSADAVSLETYVTDYLGLDMNSETGKQVYARLNSLPQETLDNLSANDFAYKGNYAADPKNGKPLKALAGKSFDEVADILSSKGIGIRTQDEMAVILNSPQYKKQREEIAFRQNVAQNVGLVYDQAIAEITAYKDSQGWINVGYWREKLGNLLKNKWVDTSFEATIERLEKEKQYAISRLSSYSGSKAGFKREFKAVTGVEYDESKIKKFLEEASKEGNDWSAAYKQAYGSDIADWAKSRVETVSTTDGICDIAAMLIGTEVIAGTTVFKGTVKGISTQVGKFAGTKGTQVVTSMAAGGLNLGSWTLLSGTVNNLTKESPTTSEDWKNLGYGTLSSVGFGAAGGLLNTTVVDKVVKGVSKSLDKPAAKAMSAVEKSLEKGASKSGTEIMTEYIMNETPGFIAKSAGFATEIAGFTVYETAVDICKDFFTKDGFNEESMRQKLIELGKEPDEVKDLSGAELVASYLGNTTWGQVKMLGEVKGVANLMMMMRGGRAAQKLAFEENLKDCESLKDVKVRKVAINGKEVYEVTFANGNRATASSVADIVGNLNFMMQIETLSKVAKAEQVANTEVKLDAPKVKAEGPKTPEVKYNPNEKAELQQLLKSQGYNTEIYTFKDKILKNEEQTHILLDLLKDKDIKKLKLSPSVLENVTPENVEVFKKLTTYKKLTSLKPDQRDYAMHSLLHSEVNTELLSILLDRGIVDGSNCTNVWLTLVTTNEQNIEYMKDFLENSSDLFISQLLMNPKEFSQHLNYVDKNNAELAKDLRNSKLLLPEQLYAACEMTSNFKSSFDANRKAELVKHIEAFSPDVKEIFAKHGFSLDNISDILNGNRAAVSISKEQQSEFLKSIIANNNPQSTKVLSEFDFSQFGKDGVPLKYSRQDFIKNINEIVKDLSPADRTVVLGHFGLDANFDGLINNKPFTDKTVPEQVQIAAQKVLTEIENFTVKNETTVKDADAKAVLDGLIQGLPEFTSVIGKQQHGTHAYSVDVHMLKVLQSAMKDPLYDTLSDQGKTILKMSALLHDIGKATGVVDSGHFRTSSEYMYSILDKFNLSNDVKQRIIDTVDNHHWFGEYNTGKLSAEEAASKMRHSDDLAIYKLMAKADLENVNGSFHLSRTGTKSQAEFDTYFEGKMKPVEDAVKLMHETAPVLMDTKILNNGDKFPTKRVNVNGEELELKVLDFSELSEGESLEQYGFAPGVTRENATFSIHMTQELEDTYNLLNSSRRLASNHPALSTSMVRATEGKSYGGYGFILDVDNANLVQASPSNFASGMKKDLKNQHANFFSSPGRSYYRNVIIDEIKQKSGVTLSEAEYATLFEQHLSGKKYASQIKDDIKIGDKVIKAEDLKNAIEKATSIVITENVEINNEVVTIDPQIKALVVRNSSGKLEDCSAEFLEFAKKHNLPIVIMPENVAKIASEKKVETTVESPVEAQGVHDALQAEQAQAPREYVKSPWDLLVDEHISNSEANAILRQHGLSEQEIADLRNQVREPFNSMVETLNILTRNKADMDLSKMSVEEIKETIREFSTDEETLKVVKFFNEKNLKIFSEKFKITEDKEVGGLLLDILNADIDKRSEFEQNFVKAQEIADIADIPLGKVISDIRGENSERIAKLTPERLRAQKAISEVLGIDFKIWAAEDIKNPELITPEYLQDLKSIANRMEKLNISREYGWKDPVAYFAEAKEMVAAFENAGLDFSWYKDAFYDCLRLDDAKELLKQKDLAKVKTFIDACSPECKEKFAHYIIDFACNESRVGEEYADFINTLSTLKAPRLNDRYGYDDFKSPTQLATKLEEIGVTDFKGVAELLRAFDDANAFPSTSSGIERKLKLANGDYDNAAKFVRQLTELFGDKKGLFHYGYDAIDDYMTYSWKPDIDFKRAVDRMDAVLKSDLAKDDHALKNISSLVASEHPQAIELFELLGRHGFTDTSLVREILKDNTYNVDNVEPVIDVFLERAALDNPLSEVPTEIVLKALNYGKDNHNNMYLLKHMIDKEIFDFQTAKEKIGWHYNFELDVTSENKSLITKLLTDKELNFPIDEVGGIARWSNANNIDFVTRLCTDKELDFPSYQIEKIAQVACPENIELLTRLCTDKQLDFPQDKIEEIARYTNLENAEFVTRLCTDKTLNFPPENIANVARFINSENIEFMTRLCTDKEINFPPEHVANVACYTNPSNIDFITRLCTDKEINFPPEHIAGVASQLNPSNMEFAEKLCTAKDLIYLRPLISRLLLNIGQRTYSIETIKNNIEIARQAGLNPEIFPDVVVNSSIDMSNLLNVKAQLGTERNIQKFTPNELSILTNNLGLMDKTILENLSKTEKRNLLNIILKNKNDITLNNVSLNLRDVIPLLPTNQSEYVKAMNEVSRSLNVSLKPVSAEEVQKFDQSVKDLSTTLGSIDLSTLSDIRLQTTHQDFVGKINNIMKNLSNEEQAKIQAMFGFRIVDGKLTGYPKSGVDINSLEFADKNLLNAIKTEVDNYSDNNVITVKDNPPLNDALNTLIQTCPEIMNQIDGTPEFSETVKSLQRIVKDEKFEKLSQEDKKILLMGSLLRRTDKQVNTTRDAAFDAFFMGKKFNLSDEAAQKLYSIVDASDCVEIFMDAKHTKTVRDYRGTQIIGRDIQDKFDLMALSLKEGNTLDLAQLLYSSQYKEGFTRYFDKLLQNRVNEIKASDFILPQTPKETYLELSESHTVERGENKYNVQVVKAADIPDMYALIHTPEAGYATGGTRDANLANFEAFATLNDDKVICTAYVSPDKAGLVKEYHNGFVFEVQNDKQYVAYGKDIFSLGKNISDIVVEYYRAKGIQANRNRGDKYDHRTMVSNVMKSLLYGEDYYVLYKSLDAQMLSTPNLKVEDMPEYQKMKAMDEQYIARLDAVKEKLGNKPMSLENLEAIDPEFAQAYRTFLSRNGSENTSHEASLLRSGWHNEVLISNPKIAAIFTDNIEKLPEEYLQKAQTEGLPIVVFDTSK